MPHRRIIKDVMRHRSKEEKKPKTNQNIDHHPAAFPPAPPIPEEDEIDPADFFDPEEFGVRRRGYNPPRP
jgi:hypothetical protein